jgi:hypothetical protein
MVFTTDAYDTLVPKGETLGGVQLRYASWDDAETGHATMIKRLRKQIEFAQSGGYETKQETEVARPTS